MCKRSFRSELLLSGYWQNINFYEIVPNFTYSQNCNFKNFIGKRKTNCFYPVNFMAGACNLLFHFDSCEPLRLTSPSCNNKKGNKWSLTTTIFFGCKVQPAHLLPTLHLFGCPSNVYFIILFYIYTFQKPKPKLNKKNVHLPVTATQIKIIRFPKTQLNADIFSIMSFKSHTFQTSIIIYLQQ